MIPTEDRLPDGRSDRRATLAMPWLVLVATFATFATGCTSSRAVTPWLRTYSHHPFELIAESGGHARGRSWAERRVAGRWITDPDLETVGFSFAHGTRAVLGQTLLTEDGRTIPLACDGRGVGNGLRATPRGGLLCVESRGQRATELPPEVRGTVRVVRFDDDGAVRGEQVVSVPVRLAPSAPVFAEASTEFVGFLGDELVFSVFESNGDESWASETWKMCRAFALNNAGTWREVGRMRFQAGDVWKIHSARQWSAVLGVRVEPGAYPRTPDSAPNW